MEKRKLPVAIIGAGPVGLAAAANLVLRDQPFILFEAGDTVGANVRQWGHVRVFSPWRYNIDKAARLLLEGSGWQAPNDDDLPTGHELYRDYFLPLSSHPSLKPFIHLSSKVIAVGRKGADKMKTRSRELFPFVVRVEQEGRVKQFEASAIIDASGTWQQPNPLGAGGLPAMGEVEHKDRIFYGIPDLKTKHRHRYASRSVAVIGAGHSAINTLLDLEQLQQEHPSTSIHWILRKENLAEVYGGRQDDALAARGELGIRIERLVNENKLSVYTPFAIDELLSEGDKLTLIGEQHGRRYALSGIDEIVVNTGSRPQYDMLRELRVQVDASLESVPALAELIDPNLHSCGTVRAHGELELRQPEKDFYVVGVKSYGRAPTFLMATGYEQVRSVAAALSGDWESARRVELDLPETGVCSSDAGGGSCCATPQKNEQKTLCCG